MPRYVGSAIPFFILLAALSITFAAYYPGLTGPFLLDDHGNIPEASITSLNLDHVLSRIRQNERLSSLSRSITHLTFALTQYFRGYSASVFKYENVLLHLANALLIFWLILLLSPHQLRRAGSLPAYFALLAAAIWLSHPLQVSTVLYSVQRLVLLSTFFTLLALIFYIKGRLIIERHPLRGFFTSFLGVLTFGSLGLLSKETAALIPLYIAIIELIFFSQKPWTPRQPLQKALIFLLIAAPLTLAIAYAATNFGSLTQGYVGREFSLEQRLLTEIHVLWFYLRLFFVPIPGDMSLFHDAYPIQYNIDIQTLALFAGLLALAISAIVYRKKHPLLSFAILWFLAAHALESTFLPLELVFEHRNYLALLGPSIVVSSAIFFLFPRSASAKLRSATGFALFLLLSLNTAARAFVWSDQSLMYHTEYAERPQSSRVLSGMLQLAVTYGHDDQALQFIDQLKKFHGNEAAPYLSEILLHCRHESLPDDTIRSSQALLKDGLLTAYTLNTLNQLVDFWLKAKCPAIQPNSLLDLTSAASNNPRVHNSTTACFAKYLHLRATTATALWQEARLALDDSIEACKHRPPQVFAKVIQSFITAATNAGRADKAISILNDVSKRHGQDLMKLYKLPSAL